MDSLKSAMDSYNALHGGWYKGRESSALQQRIFLHHTVSLSLCLTLPPPPLSLPGKLVTAKYIPEVKYHKWFPVALNAKTPILQS